MPIFTVPKEEAQRRVQTDLNSTAYIFPVGNKYGFALKGWHETATGGEISISADSAALTESEALTKIEQLKVNGFHIVENPTYDTERELIALFAGKKNEIDEQIRVQNHVLNGLTHILSNLGIFTASSSGIWRLLEVDRPTKRFTWKMNVGWDSATACRVVFERPKYLDSILVFGNPIVRSRTQENAMLFKVQNQTDQKISKVISKEIKKISNVRASNSQEINFNITAGFEAGIEGTDTNFGSRAIGKLETSFGGAFKWEKETGSGSEDTRTYSDTLEFEPMTESLVQMYYDKIALTKDFTVSAVADWEKITLITDGAQQGLTPLVAQNATVIEEDGWFELIAKLCGVRNIKNTFYVSTPEARRQGLLRNDQLARHADAMKAIARSNRLLEYKGSLDYDDAGDLSLAVTELGHYVYDAKAERYELIRKEQDKSAGDAKDAPKDEKKDE